LLSIYLRLLQFWKHKKLQFIIFFLSHYDCLLSSDSSKHTLTFSPGSPVEYYYFFSTNTSWIKFKIVIIHIKRSSL